MKTLKIITAVLLLAACSTDDAPSQESLLPPITTTGENTFGCLVNGKYFRPRDGRITINSDNKGLFIYQTEEDNFEIIVNDFKSDKTGNLTIHLEDLFLLNIGVYNLDEATGLRGIDGPDHNNMYGRFWSSDTQSYQRYVSFPNSGTVVVSRREFSPNQYNIYSGTFVAKLINTNNENDTIQVSLGRFDIDSPSFLYKPYD